MRKMTIEEHYMKEAIRQAKKAAALKEVPIGCVIVYDGKIIARGYNRRNIDKNTLAHAELSAIRKASKKTGDWRLEDCDLYVTLEPCQMCAGAIVQSRMRRVIIGSMIHRQKKAGLYQAFLTHPLLRDVYLPQSSEDKILFYLPYTKTDSCIW